MLGRPRQPRSRTCLAALDRIDPGLDDVAQGLHERLGVLRLDEVPAEDDTPCAGPYGAGGEGEGVSLVGQLLGPEGEDRHGRRPDDLREPVTGVERLDQVHPELGHDPTADRDDLVALLGRDVLVTGRVDLADDRHAGLALLGDAPSDHGHVLGVDGFGAGLDRHPDQDDVGAQGGRLGGTDHRHAAALVVAPLGRVLRAPVEPDHHRRRAASLEDRGHVAGHARTDEDGVRAAEPADDGQADSLKPGRGPVVEAVVDRRDDGDRVRLRATGPGGSLRR